MDATKTTESSGLLRILLRIIVIAAATLVLLEVSLQVLALAAWWTRPSVTPAGSGSRTVLCVGDSYTFGLGASEPAGAYPAQLERLLEQRLGPGWRVVNRGVPGRNSRELLERLESMLSSERPRYLCVVVGVNDTWSRPAPYDADDAGVEADSFVWRLRTPRLLSLFGAIGVLSSDEPPASRPPAPGRWRVVGANLPLVLDAGGDGALGDAPLSWSITSDRLRLEAAGSSRTLRWTWHGDHVVLEEPGGDRLVLAPANENLPDATVDAFHLLRHARHVEDWERALDLGRSMLDEELPRERETAVRTILLEACVKTGRNGDAERHLDSLLTLLRTEASAASSARAANALRLAGHNREALALLRREVERFPGSARLWQTLAECAMGCDEIETALRASDRVVVLLDSDPDASADPGVWRIRSLLYRDRDAGVAVESAVREFLAAPRPQRTRQTLRLVRQAVTEERLEQAMERLAVPAETRATLLDVHGQAFDAHEDRVVATLTEHLRRIVRMAREHGARTLLGSYPWSHAYYYEAGRSVARTTGATWLQLSERFDEALARDPAPDLFVYDGHCNDAGYALVAEAFADAIAAMETSGR